MDFTLTDNQVKEVIDMHEYVREHYDLGNSYQFFKSKHSGSDKLCQKLKIHIEFDEHIDNDEIHIHNKRVLMHLSAKDKTISPTLKTNLALGYLVMTMDKETPRRTLYPLSHTTYSYNDQVAYLFALFMAIPPKTFIDYVLNEMIYIDSDDDNGLKIGAVELDPDELVNLFHLEPYVIFDFLNALSQYDLMNYYLNKYGNHN